MSSFIKTLDEAMKTLVFNKFATYLSLTTQATDLEFGPKSIAQRRIAEKRGQSSTEFISIWRNPPHFDWSRQRTPLARRGMLMEYTNGNTTDFTTIKAVPATIDYDVYFWTKDLDKAMQITEAYLFWIHVNPQLSVYFNDKYLMELDMNFGDIVDESPLDQIYEKGVYFVYRAPVRLDGWVVISTTTKTILTIIMSVYYNETLATATPANSELLTTRTITEAD